MGGVKKERKLAGVHHFPVWLSRFIGRDAEIAAILRLLQGGRYSGGSSRPSGGIRTPGQALLPEQARLLTLTGPGGSGKTRLALEAARAAQDTYPEGVWLLELGPLVDPDLIAQTAAFCFGLTDQPDRPILERLIEHLAPQRLLLVMDNCEHLIEGSARLAYALLAGCPDLQILATSREPLHVAGEVLWPVPPLALTDWVPGQPAEGLLKSEAVQLFVERAAALNPAFELSPRSAGAVYEICRQLDGIPLALELAAAHARLLSPGELAARVGSAIHWLSSADRLAPPRQQTLRSALDWSYQLLSPAEQALFRRLSVFLGGFNLEAAEHICAEVTTGDLTSVQVQPLLYRLVDKSFVSRDAACADAADDASTRFHLLEVVRQYAAEKLAAAGEETALRERCIRWYVDFAEKSDSRIVGVDRGAWIAQVDEELPNLRRALAWAVEGGFDPTAAHRLARALAQFWQLRGYIHEGITWLEAVLDCQEGVEQNALAYTYLSAAFMVEHLWDTERGRSYTEQAAALFQALGHQRSYAFMLTYMALTYIQERDFAKARALVGESLALYQPYMPDFGASAGLMHLGDMAYMEDNYAEAERYFAESLAMSEGVGNLMGAARRRVRLAQAVLAGGDVTRAQAILAESIQASLGTGDRWVGAMIMVAAAALAWEQGRRAYAARCLGKVQACVEVFGTHLWALDRFIFDRYQARVRDRLGQEAFNSACEEGHIQVKSLASMDEALSEVLENLSGDPADRAGRRALKAAYGGLTAREREVAALIAQGHNNAQIAAALFVGVRTVETHITHILTKLNFTSRTQIAVWVSERAL